MQIPVPPLPTPPLEYIVLTDVVPTIVVAVAAVTALGLLLRAWSQRALHRGDAAKIRAGLEVLHNSIEDMRADQESLALDVRDRLSDLSGRVEFAERMLAPGKDDERPGSA